MIVRQLSLSNFMGYRKRCELDFRGKQTIGIVGNNESGKSSLLSAVCYAAFGDVPILNQETREVALISDGGTADLLVEAELELPSGEVISIARGRTRSNSPIVRLDGYQGKPSELSHLIEQKVGMPFEDFVALSYFVQGDIHQFMDGNKREFFQRWAYRLQRWERYETAAKDRAADLEQERAKLQQDAERNAVAPDELEEAKLELEAARAEVVAAEEQRAIRQDQVDQLRDEAATVKQKQAEAHGEVKGLAREREQVAGMLDSLDRRVSSLKSQIRDASAGMCPQLKVHCEKLAKKIDERSADARRELGRVQGEQAEAQERQKDLTLRQRALQGKVKASTDDAEHVLSEATRGLGQATSEVARAHGRVGRAEERLTTLRHQVRKACESGKAIAVAEESLRRTRFLQAMCGRSGIPMEVMDSELQHVEDRCNWVLERLDYPKRIRFAAYRELAGYERVCPYCGGEAWRGNTCAGCGRDRPHKHRDEPAVTVLEGAVERPFSLESGGARVLQSFAVRLACSLFRASMTGAQVRMVMLDEVFAMLDTANRQKLMGLVIGKLASEFGLKQQFVVSHQEDVVNTVDDIILVQKRGGSSVARWA